MKKKLTVREKCIKEIKRLDPKIEKPEEQHAAIFLLAAAQVGPTFRAILKASELPFKTCRKYFRAAVEGKIFVRGKIRCEWFEKHGTIALWCDTLTLDGMLRRTK